MLARSIKSQSAEHILSEVLTDSWGRRWKIFQYFYPLGMCYHSLRKQEIKRSFVSKPRWVVKKTFHISFVICQKLEEQFGIWKKNNYCCLETGTTKEKSCGIRHSSLTQCSCACLLVVLVWKHISEGNEYNVFPGHKHAFSCPGEQPNVCRASLR